MACIGAHDNPKAGATVTFNLVVTLLLVVNFLGGLAFSVKAPYWVVLTIFGVGSIAATSPLYIGLVPRIAYGVAAALGLAGSTVLIPLALVGTQAVIPSGGAPLFSLVGFSVVFIGPHVITAALVLLPVASKLGLRTYVFVVLGFGAGAVVAPALSLGNFGPYVSPLGPALGIPACVGGMALAWTTKDR